MITQPNPFPSDIELLMARARAGDNAAWEELFHTCYPKVIRVVRTRLNPPMRSLYDSTDFASDVMKSLAENLDRLDFDSIDSLMAFLAQVARQKVIDEYRKANTLKRKIDRQQPLAATDASGGAGLASGSPTPSKFAQADETHAGLLHGTSREQREIIEMRRDGYSNEEISRRVGWNIRKVQRYLRDLEDRYFPEASE